MRIRIVGSGEYAKYSLEYDVLRSTTVMMVKVQIMVELFKLDEAVEAAEEGATIVRIGTAIYGARDYAKH